MHTDVFSHLNKRLHYWHYLHDALVARTVVAAAVATGI
jgi:hypothetical protein